MSKVRVAAFALTLDGFSAGPDQSLQNPLGVNDVEMMDWFLPPEELRARICTGVHGSETRA